MKIGLGFIENSILQSIKLPEMAGENGRYYFKCADTRRVFDIRHRSDAFFLEEIIPVGLWDDTEHKRVFEEIYQDMLAENSPNTFRSALESSLLSRVGVSDPDEHRYQIIDGVNPNSGRPIPIYYDSVKACATAIGQSLYSNTYYASWRPRTPAVAELTKDEEIAIIKQSISYWQGRIESIDLVEPKTVFSGTHLMDGIKLSDKVKDDLLNYFNVPTAELWDCLYDVIIVGHRTLWQAWSAVDESAPRSHPRNAEWGSIPGGDQLREALVYCVRSTKKNAEAQLAENEDLLKSLTKPIVRLSLVVNPPVAADENDNSPR